MTNNELDILAAQKEIRILFVCLGNICRSPAAQGVMQRVVDDHGAQSRFLLDSAGTYAGHAGDLPDKRMRVHAARRGYDLTHRARKVQPWDFDDFDIIVAMDASNAENLRRLAPSVEAARKIVMMTDFCRSHPQYDAVPDPYYEGAEGFELVLDLLEDACRGLYDRLSE